MRDFKKSKKLLSLSLSLGMAISICQFNVSATDINSNNNLRTDKALYNGPKLDASKRPKLENPKTKSKLDSKLLELTGKKSLSSGRTKETLRNEMKSQKQLIPAGSYVKNAGKSTSEDLVYVYILTKTSEGIKKIEPYTFKVDNEDIGNKMLAAWVDIETLKQLELLNEVTSVQTVVTPKVHVDSEGDQFHRANLVRSLSNGSTGKGMKVGVISDGVDHLSDSIRIGALNQVTVLSNSVSGDEGTAMLEIVHALAPDASLYFHDLGGNTIAFNQAVDDLAAAGCNIIVDDVQWLLEPFFEDGTVAKHVSDVINAKGIVYVSAAGNSGNSHFIGSYYNDGYDWNDFSSGKVSDYKYMYMKIQPGETVSLVLQWDDNFSSSSNDYDLYLYNTANSSELDSSTIPQTGSGSKPLEFIQYTNNTGITIDAEIDINNYEGKASPKMLNLYIYGRNYANNVVKSNSIFGHTAAPEVISVGAIEVSNPNQIASYSSQGPVLLLNGATRQKPDVSGAAGVTVSGSGGFPTKFSGTSAAAPHIAAIAALLWAADTSMTNRTVKDLIFGNTGDLGASGYDSIFGYGKADAYSSFMKLPSKTSLKPNAVIKNDAITYQGFKVQLDGRDSSVGQGTSLTYNWQLIAKPSGSQAVLIDSTTSNPYFIADTPGDYRFSLSVNDSKETSTTVFSTVMVKDISSTTDDIDLYISNLNTSLDLGASGLKKPIALTDGWLITADSTNKVKILNVYTGTIGKEYQLSAAVNSIDFDFNKKIIVASLENANNIAVIDINKDSISYVSTPFSYNKVTFGKNNIAFALTSEWPYAYVSVIDINQGKILNTQQLYAEDFGLIAYNKNNSNLYLGEIRMSPSSLARYYFDETTYQLTLKQSIWDMGSNGQDLSLSPDGNSLAFACGGGNTDYGYVTLDIDSSDISKSFGEWNVGAYPTSSGFTLDSKYIVISNYDELRIFNAKNHSLFSTIKRKDPYHDNDGVLFSRGGKLLYDFYSGKIDCFKSNIVSTSSTDTPTQPIVMTKGEVIAFKGFKIGLDGTSAYSGSGSPLTYKWFFDTKPDGSLASFKNGTTATPYFTADAVGNYTIRLIVNDGTRDIDVGKYIVKIKDMNSTTDDINVTSASLPAKQLSLNAFAKPIALSDGWVITADGENKINITNVVTGAIGKQYQLSTSPSSTDFDYDKKLIVASLKNANKIAVINTVNDDITYIDTDYHYDAIVFGKNNLAFALSRNWPDSNISAIDISQKKVLSSSGTFGEDFGLISYNKVTGSLYLGEVNTSPASLASYSYNEALNQFTRNQFINDFGSNGLGLAVSPDGKHLAFCAGSGNGSGYNVFDIDASNLSNKFGSWNTDAYPTAGSFTLDSKNVILSNGSQVKIFNVQNHSLLKTLDISVDGSSSVVFSRGGKLAFTSGSTNVTCFDSGIQQSLLKGDFDFSGSVTILELASLSKSYNIRSSSIDTWNPELDLNSDGIVDIFDLVLLSKNIH